MNIGLREKIGVTIAMSMGIVAGATGIVKSVMVQHMTSPDITCEFKPHQCENYCKRPGLTRFRRPSRPDHLDYDGACCDDYGRFVARSVSAMTGRWPMAILSGRVLIFHAQAHALPRIT